MKTLDADAIIARAQHRRQVAGPTFYQRHLLFDTHDAGVWFLAEHVIDVPLARA